MPATLAGKKFERLAVLRKFVFRQVSQLWELFSRFTLFYMEHNGGQASGRAQKMPNFAYYGTAKQVDTAEHRQGSDVF